MGEVIKLLEAEARDDGGRERFYDDSVWEAAMHVTHGGHAVTLWRRPESGWWWSMRRENATDPIERSPRPFATRREARDAAWRALRRLAADAAKGGGK